MAKKQRIFSLNVTLYGFMVSEDQEKLFYVKVCLIHFII
jgi:hypothetical protein